MMQANWISRSEGAWVRFPWASPLADQDMADQGLGEAIEIFTTRPDTLFGASFIAVAPSHPIAVHLAQANPDLALFMKECEAIGMSESAIERAEKQGYDTGLKVCHPFRPDTQLPVYCR